MHTKDIKQQFIELLAQKKFISVNREASMTDLVGSTTIEIVNANFIADDEAIFGTVNREYIEREEQWYNSMSLNVNDIPGGAPAVWKAVADKDGFINSNYGWCIYSPENGTENNQYYSAVNELYMNPESRRAMMIYTRPSMWTEYNLNGRSDFMCTNTVQYLVRDGAVHAIVQMRSNDAVFGYKNDRAWQQHVLEKVTNNLNELGRSYNVGNLYWNAGSLHVYARHFHLIDPINYPQPKGN
jgi:thymidylate synthase